MEVDEEGDGTVKGNESKRKNGKRREAENF